MRNLLFISLFVIALSCTNREERDNACQRDCCKKVKLMQYYVQENGDEHKITSSHHTVLVKSYQNSCFNDLDFFKLAKEYLDTTKYHPIYSIKFIKSTDGFHPLDEDQRYSDKILDNTIIGFGLKRDTIRNIYLVYAISLPKFRGDKSDDGDANIIELPEPIELN